MAGLGVSGLAAAFLLSRHGVAARGYELASRDEWAARFRRPTLLRPGQLELLRRYTPLLYDVLAEYTSPVYLVRKIVLDGGLEPAGEYSIRSDTPLYYLVDVEGLALHMLGEAGLLEAYWAMTGVSVIDATGGRVWGNIRGYARETGCSGLTVWYLPETAPSSYMFESPITPGSAACTRALILFDDDTGIPASTVTRILGGPPTRSGVTGYAKPRLTEGSKYTVGERGGWIDPLRGYSLAYAMLSAAAAVEAIVHGRPPGWLRRVEEELRESHRMKPWLRRLGVEGVKRLLERDARVTG